MMADRGSLAVHHLFRVHDNAAESLPDRLVAQADAEDRHLAGELFDERHRYARFVRRARSGGNHDMARFHLSDLLERDFVIAIDGNVLLELGKVLDKVVRERVVIVDHQQHKTSNYLICKIKYLESS